MMWPELSSGSFQDSCEPPTDPLRSADLKTHKENFDETSEDISLHNRSLDGAAAGESTPPIAGLQRRGSAIAPTRCANAGADVGADP